MSSLQRSAGSGAHLSASRTVCDLVPMIPLFAGPDNWARVGLALTKHTRMLFQVLRGVFSRM